MNGEQHRFFFVDVDCVFFLSRAVGCYGSDVEGVPIALARSKLETRIWLSTETTARNHSSRPASTASLSTSKGTSYGPLVCLCYTRVAMHGRSFPSARRVVVVVLPLPSVLNVFLSVEPTTIVYVCTGIQFAGFEN